MIFAGFALFFYDYFFEFDFIKNIAYACLKFCLVILQTHLEGTVSQIYYSSLRFCYGKNRKVVYEICKNYFLNHIE